VAVSSVLRALQYRHRHAQYVIDPAVHHSFDPFQRLWRCGSSFADHAVRNGASAADSAARLPAFRHCDLMLDADRSLVHRPPCLYNRGGCRHAGLSKIRPTGRLDIAAAFQRGLHTPVRQLSPARPKIGGLGWQIRCSISAIHPAPRR
jgi:hypothetical protein